MQNFTLKTKLDFEGLDEELAKKAELKIRTAMRGALDSMSEDDKRLLIEKTNVHIVKNYKDGDFIILKVDHDVKVSDEGTGIDESTVNDFSVRIVQCYLFLEIDEERNIFAVQHSTMFTENEFPEVEVYCY